jgi:AcrR family transcriptional regulator
MPRPKRTESEIVAMQEKILASAESILQQKGPQGLSIRAIAEHVGVSHMVLYSYFDSREELVSALRERHRKRNQQRHEEILEKAKTGDVRNVMRKVLQDNISFAHKNPRIFRFLWGPRDKMSHLDCENKDKKHHSKGILREVQLLSEIIKLGIEKHEFIERDPEITAYLIMGTINTPLIMDQFLNAIDKKTLEKLEKEALKTCINYLIGQEM